MCPGNPSSKSGLVVAEDWPLPGTHALAPPAGRAAAGMATEAAPRACVFPWALSLGCCGDQGLLPLDTRLSGLSLLWAPALGAEQQRRQERLPLPEISRWALFWLVSVQSKETTHHETQLLKLSS